ncbi:MAG: xanthine dehydrogenase family protein subunit M [Daejeonella sp.]|uniref:FAD binding domain-containing protein n=1 Tax=Daejeonella sp. TaxID=2805397 RepID=UPI003C766B9F
MVPFNYLKVTNADEASAHFSKNSNAEFIAGGTNLIDLMKENVARPDTLIDINKIESIQSITELADGGLRLGALVKNADTAYNERVRKQYPLLSQAILAGASAQLRNMASNGGNLLQRTRCYYFYDTATPCNKRAPGTGCSAIGGYNRIHAVLGTSKDCIAVFPSDMCVALAALNARVNIHGLEGGRVIDFIDFHRLPGDTPNQDNNLKKGDLITSIDLPDESFDFHYSYLKLRDRSSYAFALVSVAAAFKLEDGLIRDARLALGGVAHKPWRNREAEDFMIGKEPNSMIFSQVASIILDEAAGFEHNTFKIELTRRAIIKNCLTAVNKERI